MKDLPWDWLTSMFPGNFSRWAGRKNCKGWLLRTGIFAFFGFVDMFFFFFSFSTWCRWCRSCWPTCRDISMKLVVWRLWLNDPSRQSFELPNNWAAGKNILNFLSLKQHHDLPFQDASCCGKLLTPCIWSRRAGEIAFVRDQPRSTDKEAFGKDAKARLAKIQRQERLRKRTADSWTLLSVTQSMTEKRKVGKLQERFFLWKASRWCEGGFFQFVKFEKSLDTLDTFAALHWGHWSWADFWSSWQQLNLSGNLDTDSNSEFMNASTGIGRKHTN